MRNPRHHSLLGWTLCPVLVVLVALVCTFAATAHETDQFTVPAGRQFADLGSVYSRWFYTAISKGMDATNAQIKSALESKNESALRDAQDGATLAHRVNKSLPWAMDVIEGWDNDAVTPAMQARFPGYVTGYKHPLVNIYQHTHFVLDPRQFFRVWLGRTIKVYGTYLGSDKIGHFTDNGMNLYNAYLKAKNRGESEEKAVAAALRLSTDDPLLGEKGMVGYGSAGDYSNGDLAANFTGFLFYKNLYEPVMLKGAQQPPLCVREGPYWRLAPHVRPDSDFMALFVDDHLDEALNPGHFEGGMRNALRAAILERREIVLEQYRDEHGNRRPRAWFDKKLADMKTYYGVNYGYVGPYDQLVSIPNTLFPRIDDKANANARNKYGETPLHLAAAAGDAAVIRALLARGADVNAQLRSDERYNSDWGSTALHFAAASGNRDAVQALLAANADVNLRTDRGVTALHRAVKFNDVAQLLIERGAKVDVADAAARTPLHWCANDADDCNAVASTLIARGASVAARDRDGRTPLHLAADAGRTGVASVLLRGNADVNAADAFGATPLHLAAAHRYAPVLETLARANGARINAPDAFGCTPLHDAARVGSADAVATLLRAGASPALADAYGRTPEAIARGANYATVAELLAPAGAATNTRTIGMRDPSPPAPKRQAY